MMFDEVTSSNTGSLQVLSMVLDLQQESGRPLPLLVDMKITTKFVSSSTAQVMYPLILGHRTACLFFMGCGMPTSIAYQLRGISSYHFAPS